MLDIKYIRNNIEIVKETVRNKNSKVDIDRLLELDHHRRELMSALEDLQKQKNEVAKKIAEHRGDQTLIEQGKVIRAQIEEADSKLRAVDDEFQPLLLSVPNISSADTPIGKDDSENVVLRTVGSPRAFDFEPKPHWEIGEVRDLIRTEQAGLVSGSRFAYLTGGLVHLQFALISWALSIVCNADTLEDIADQAGLDISPKPFTPVLPPLMIKPDVFQKMARLEPREERYHIPSDDLYLIGSAEHTLGPLHMNEIIKEESMPIRYVGYSSAFRREAGSHGKDVRGILRLHQFDKLEMESFCLPEDSQKEQDFFVAIQEYLMKKLDIPYRVVICCTGDMGDPDARHLDLESWMPGQNTYRETHSADLMTDYQSRRLNTRVKRADGNEYVHMNDATLLALGRAMIAIMENYQQADGSVDVPAVLRPYMPRNLDRI